MPADHSTPEGRRCPECGIRMTRTEWSGGWVEYRCEVHGRVVPTPAPVGGNNTTLGDTIARERMPTPTSAEGGAPASVAHERIADPRCVTASLRDPDTVAHLVTARCSREEPHAMAECGEFDPPTLAATGGEDSDSIRRAILYDPRLYAAYTIGRQREAAEADSLRRQLAEAEETARVWIGVAETRRVERNEAEQRATTAERRLADAANAIPEVSGPVDERIRVLRQHHADQFTASQQEVARLREALTFYGTVANWHSPSTGFAAQYDPAPSPIDVDHGDQARAALSTPQQGEEQGA